MSDQNIHTAPVFENPDASSGVFHSKDVERIVAISGPDPKGRPKAHVLLHHYEQFSDGTMKDIQILNMDKPIVNIFMHAGFVNVYLDFGSRNDMDLRVMWDMLMEYSRPVNSVSYLPDELESGYYNTPDGPQMVYFPVLNLALSPIGKEEEFMVYGYNPAFFTLAPNNTFGEPCVVQFTFPEESFFVVEDLEVDHEKIQSEIVEELEAEKRGYNPPDTI